MNKCLVTKLNGVVSNKNLTPLGCIAFTVDNSNSTLKLDCEGNNVEYFTANGEAVFSTDKSDFVNRISANQVVYVKVNKPTLVFISNKYELAKLDIYDSVGKALIYIDLSDLKYCKKLTWLAISNLSLTGDISSLSSLTNLQTLELAETSVSGDISSFNNMVKLSVLKMGNIGTGYFKTLCNSLKNNGRTSGTLIFWAFGGLIKIDNQTECPNNDVIATFSEGSISYKGL